MGEEVKDLLIKVSATTELLRSQLTAAERDIASFASKAEASGKVVENTFKRAGAGAGAQRAGLQQLSYQISDISTQFALGAKPMQIFAAQSGQVVGALGLMAGEGGKLAGFLGGPWGIAITAGIVALSPFIGKLFDTSDAIQEVNKDLDDLAKNMGRATGVQLAAARLDYELKAAKVRKLERNAPPPPGPRANAYEVAAYALTSNDGELAKARQERDDAKQLLDTASGLARLNAGQIAAENAANRGGSSGRRSSNSGGGSSRKAPALPNPRMTQQFWADMSPVATDLAGIWADAWNDTTADIADESSQKWAEIYENAAKDAAERAAQIEARQITTLAGLYQDAFKGGTDAIWKDFKEIGLAVIAQVLARFTIAQVTGKGGFNLGNAIGLSLTSVLGFADGGRPPVGRASIVGERGPELFIPDSAGTVVPNHALGNGTSVNMTINAPGATAETVLMIRRELAAASPAIVQAAAATTTRNLNRRRL